MTTWTKELPKVSGQYWFRSDHRPAEVVEWDSDMQCVQYCGMDVYLWADTSMGRTSLSEENGEFWPIKLEPPNPAPDWVAALPTMFNSPRPPMGMPSITFQPAPIKVELDPNHPHA